MDVAAKLGIIVDANGARREIQLTTDQLRHLANGGAEATATMKGLTGGMTQQAAAAQVAARGTSDLSASIARMRAAADRRLDLGLAKQIAELDPFRLRTEQGTVATTKLATSMEKMRAAARQKLDLGLASQIQQLDPFQKNLNTASNGLDNFSKKGLLAHLTSGRLANGIVDLGAHLAGVHPIIGKVIETLGMFSVGSVVTVGIIAGIATMILAWDRYTAKLREAQKEQDELIKSGMKALQTRALGPGGESANLATAALGRILELEDARARVRSGVPWSTDRKLFESPESAIRRINQEINNLQQLVSDAEARVSIERAKAFAQSITTPFDYAVSRGQDILHFYGEAAAAQRQLNDLAKSGNQDIKQAAIQGLQQIQAILDRIQLQKLGFAEAPSRLLGLPAGMAVSGMQQTSSNLAARVAQASAHGQDITAYGSQIIDLAESINDAARKLRPDTPTSIRTGVQSAVDAVQIIRDALDLANARDRGGVAARIRQNVSAGGGFLQNAQAQQDYGAQLALREAMLKLPPVFDADREAAVRHGEKMRELTNEIDVQMKVWQSMDGVLGSFKEGLASVANDMLQQFSPSNIGKGLLGGVISTVTDYAQGLISKTSEGIRHAIFGSTSEQRAAAAAQRDQQQLLKLTIDSLRAGLKGDNLAQQIDQARQALIGLLKQINDALPGKKNEAERNRQRAEAEALERQQEQQLREQDAQRRREATEDLNVRMLRAQGRDQEADALALANEQHREYAQAVKDGADATYLATLTQVQAQEKLKAQMDATTSSAFNMVAGYKLQATVFAAMNPRGGTAPFFPSGMTPRMPTSIGNPFDSPSGDLTVNVIADGQTLGRVVLKNFKSQAQKKFGDSSRWSEIQS